MELEQKMFQLVKEWKLSNLSKSDFSNKHNVSYHSLNYWIKKFNKSDINQIPGTAFVKDGSVEEEFSFFRLPSEVPKSKKQLFEKSKTNLSKRMDIDLGNGIKITIY